MSKTEQKVKVGDRVKVYQDPVTRTDFEGEALVREVLRGPCPDGFYFIYVEFVDDPGDTWHRKVTAADVVVRAG